MYLGIFYCRIHLITVQLINFSLTAVCGYKNLASLSLHICLSIRLAHLLSVWFDNAGILVMSAVCVRTTPSSSTLFSLSVYTHTHTHFSATLKRCSSFLWHALPCVTSVCVCPSSVCLAGHCCPPSSILSSDCLLTSPSGRADGTQPHTPRREGL